MIPERMKGENRLSSEWKIIIRVVANLANGDFKSVRALLDSAKKLLIEATELYEIILQSYLFLGYPKAIEGLRALRESHPRFKPPERVELNDRTTTEWRRRGENLCRIVYGSNYDRLRRTISTLSPDLDDWMVWEGYGKVLSRDGVRPELRELCTCAALAVTGDFVQLHSHMRGAIHTGATVEMLREMLQSLDGIARSDRLRQADEILAHVSRKAGEDA